MIAVSQEFKNVWANTQVRKAVFKVQYKRRFFNGSEFVLETVAKIVRANEIVKISPIQWKMDVTAGATILASNLTLVLKNDKFKWLESNDTDGLFVPDAIAPSGYDPYKTEFQIFYGYILLDDTTEFVTLFTGEAEDYIPNSDKGTISIFVKGQIQLKLEGADAQRVSTNKVNVATIPPSGDDSNTEFLTDFSVWEISKVRENLSEIGQGSRWKLSDQNDAELRAKLTITPAPTAGQVIDYTGRQQIRNSTMSALMGLICDEAGITPASREIEEPNFPATSQFKQIESKADWDAGLTLTNVETGSRDGFLVLGNEVRGRRFESQQELDDNWEKFGDVGISTADPFEGNSNVFIGGGGTIEVKLIPVGGGVTITKIISNVQSWTLETIDAGSEGPYKIEFKSGNSSIRTKVANSLIQDGTRVSFWFRVTNTFSPGGGGSSTLSIDDIRAIALADGIYVSEVFDLLAAPSTYGKLDRIDTTQGGILLYETASSDDGLSFDAFLAIDGANNIQSIARRFIKIRITLVPNAGRTDGPEINTLTLNFQSSSLFVGHADFTGKNGLQAAQRLAEIPDMELGSTGAGKFFYRNKAVIPISILELDETNAIISISPVKPGYRAVKTVAQVQYGPYYKEIDSASEGESEPTSVRRFGRRVVKKTINDFLFANNADFAGAVIGILRTNNFRPKRTAKIITRIIPHLELADVITVSFYGSPLIKDTVFGDELQTAPSFGINKSVILRDMLSKVIGISFDIMSGKSTIDIQEVLTT